MMKKGNPKTTTTKQTSPGAMDAKEKSVYLSQIQDLSARLERLQLRCDDLKQQNHDVVKQKEHQSDTLEILQHSSAALDQEEEEVMKSLKVQEVLIEERTEAPRLQKRADALNAEVSAKATELAELQKIVESLRLLQVTSSSPVAAVKPLVDLKLLEQRWMRQKEEDMRFKEQEMEIMENVFRYYDELQECLQEVKVVKSSRSSAEDQKNQKVDTVKHMKLNLDKVLRKVSSRQQELLKKRRRCQLWSNEVKRLERSYQNQLDQNQADRQRLAELRDECLQEPSLIAQLKVQLQSERNKRMKAERDIKLSVSVLTAVMDSEMVPGAQLKMQTVLGVLEKSGSQETGTAHRETSGLRRGGPKPQTSRATALDQTSEPLDQTSEPLDQTSELLDQTSEPLDQTSEPLDQTSEPLDQTSEPLLQPDVRAPPPPTPTCSRSSPGRANLPLKKLDFWNSAFNDLKNKLDDV